MSTPPLPRFTRRILRGPMTGRLCTIAHEDPATGLLHVRVAPALGDPAPSPFDHRLPLVAFTASWLQPLT